MKFKFSKLFAGILALGLMSGALASCGDVTPTENPTNFIDYASTDERAKLKLDYKRSDGSSRNFFEDGVGQVELRNTIDGDTAHFNVPGVKGDYLKARFYGIDTPESTGQIQNWGKSASKFTSGILKEAKENGTIVVSSPQQEYTKPQLDSTGSRYLSLVWVNTTKKNAPYDELKLLNLLIVQEGFSATKAVDKVPEYADVFYDADAQAQKLGLRIWGEEDDPLFPKGDYTPVSLLAIKDEERWAKIHGTTNPYNDQNVHIEATVTGYSDHIVYVQEYYSYDWLVEYLDTCLADNKITQEEHDTRLEEGKQGVYAGIGLFTGMNFSNDSKFITPNTRLSVNGNVGHQFGLQIQGISFPSMPSGGKTEVIVLHTAAEVLANEEFADFRVHNFEVNSSDLKHDDEFLFMKVEVNNKLKVVGGRDNEKEGEVRLDVADENGKKLDFSINITFQFRPIPENPRKVWKTYEKFVGHEILVQGIYYFFTITNGDYSKSYYNVLPTDRSDVTILTPIV